MGSTLKRENLLLKGANSFLLRVDPILERLCCPEKQSRSLAIYFPVGNVDREMLEKYEIVPFHF